MNSHVVEDPDDAAAVGDQPALRVRADVRHRQRPPKSAWPAPRKIAASSTALTQEIAGLRRRLGARRRTKLGEYFDAVRDVEQRIVKAESTNSDFSVPDQPVGVPATFKEYIELMFDLQVLAFQADITRVSSLMMARENINRAYPEIGLPEAHHSISHHGNNPEKMQALREAEHVSRRDADVLPEEARSRFPTATATLLDQHRGALRQRHERRQRPQQLQRAGHGRRRTRRWASRATVT